MQADNFIEEIIIGELESGKVTNVHTRFPPEPNGFLHIGHAKSLCLNFGTAKKFNGKCNLFFDDTNPSKEKKEYIDAIKEDIDWLGFRWFEIHYASDYFDIIYDLAEKLIIGGKAYVCDLSAEEMKSLRGTLTQAGKDSPYRSRTVDENLKLFRSMKNGEVSDGEKVLRAKIDMASPNINLRDPVIYRVLKAEHHRTGNKWCVYPMYDFAHPLCDSFQGITFSLCTLEFEDHRPLYNWTIENTHVSHKPRQIEFARLNITNTLMSKRYLKKLVDNGVVDGWDDPRMPTLAGLRRRGVPSDALKKFCNEIGVAKANSEIEISYFEHFIRDNLNLSCERAMAVKRPVRLIIDNFEGKEEVDFDVNPNALEPIKRKTTFSKTVYIDSDDFSLDPPKNYFRLKPGGIVRLKGAYIVECRQIDYSENGEISAVHCTYIPESKSGGDTSGIKCKGTIHWVSATDNIAVEIHKLDYLLNEADCGDLDFSERINLNSRTVFNGYAEEYLGSVPDGTCFQMLRIGYYRKTTFENRMVLTEIVSLKDGFKK